MTGPLIMLVGGGAMIAYLVYDWMQYRMRRRMRRESSESGIASRVSYDWKVYAMLAYVAIVAFLYARGIDRPLAEEVEGFDTPMGALSFNAEGDLQDQKIYIFQVQGGDWVQVHP